MSDLAFLSSDEEDTNESLTTKTSNTKGEGSDGDDNDDDTTSESSQSSEEEFVEDFEFGGMMVRVFLSFFQMFCGMTNTSHSLTHLHIHNNQPINE